MTISKLPRARPLSDDERIVITGMGLVTPLGTGIDPFWEGVLQGRSGIRRTAHASDLACTIAAEVPDFEPQKTAILL